MIFFIVDHQVTLERNDVLQQFVTDTAYVSSLYDARQLQLDIGNVLVLDEEKVLAGLDGLIELGASNRNEFLFLDSVKEARATTSEFRSLTDQIKDFPPNAQFRNAIINGFGTGIGDTIMGLTALRVARQRLTDSDLTPDTEVWLRPHVTKRLQPVYEREGLISYIRTLPLPIEHLQRLDGYWDMSSLLDRPMFRQLPFVDFFLHTLGVDPATVLPEEKRNKIALCQATLKTVGAYIEQLARPFVLLHPKSSSQLKDMPSDVCREIFDVLITRCDFQVASVVQLPISHNRYLDLSGLSASYQELCAIVSRARGLLAIDTSVYHIADAFSVPTLVLFATTAPELHIPYYPTVEGHLLDGARDSRLFGLIKRPRDQDIHQDIEGLWRGFSPSRVVDQFLDLVERRSPPPTS